MDTVQFLSRACATPGLPGMESGVAELVRAEMLNYTEDVSVNPSFNVIGRMGKGGPKVMLSAHLDEIGLIVTRIEDDGFLRINRMGGVDPRILPGMTVTVHAKEKLTGVIGIKPPHLAAPEEANKAYGYKELSVDLGMSAERVRALVAPGDTITMDAKPTVLNKKRFAMKTLDDRACVALLLLTMERLKGVELDCEAIFVASAQEEVGSRGAKVTAYSLNPDIGIALDVTHGPQPGADEWDVVPLGKVAMTAGPGIHPPILNKLKEIADAEGVDYAIEVSPRLTYTDADEMRMTREGLPTALISVPLSYMHTTVETIEIKTLENAARLLAAFLRGIKEIGQGEDGLTC